MTAALPIPEFGAYVEPYIHIYSSQHNQQRHISRFSTRLEDIVVSPHCPRRCLNLLKVVLA